MNHLPAGKSGKTSDDTFDTASKEYKLSTMLAQIARDNANRALSETATLSMRPFPINPLPPPSD